MERSYQDEGGAPSAPVERSYQDEGGAPSAPVERSYQDDGGHPSAPLDSSYQDKDRLLSVPSYAQVIEKNEKKNKKILRKSQMDSSETKFKPIASSLSSVQENCEVEQAHNEKSPIVDDEGFTLVKNKKKTRDNIVGSKRYSGERVMKSARRLGDLYLGNLDLDVTETEIIEYIKEETDIPVDKCILLNSKNPNCKSFKISVSFESRIRLLSPEIWPEGVICLEFYN